VDSSGHHYEKSFSYESYTSAMGQRAKCCVGLKFDVVAMAELQRRIIARPAAADSSCK